MYRMTKVHWIEAAHSLPHLRNLDGSPHKCAQLHGHSYKIVITLRTGELDADGMIIDFGLLAAFFDQFDHKHLNDLFAPTTAENFCKVLWDGLDAAVLRKLNDGTPKNRQVFIEKIELWEGGKGSNVVTMSER
jgi:6-pyruvoyltetrahydropterin/6-carboxytetrahydropterin synthase